MLVKGWMSSDVISVEEETSMMKASVLMKEHNIRRLPVVKKGKLVGVVTDTNLKEASPSKAASLDIYEISYLLSEMKVKELMSKNVIYVKLDETIEFAAVLMLENKISGLPVINDQQNLIGVITETDIFKALIHITGVYSGEIQFAFCLRDKPGSVHEVANVIRNMGGRVGKNGTREQLIRAQALFDLNRRQEAEAITRDMNLLNNVQLEELRVRLAAELALPVDTYLEREEALLEAKTQGMLYTDDP